MSNRKFLVTTSDNQKMEVGENVISKAIVYVEMFKHLSLVGGTSNEPLEFEGPLPMTAATLEKVVAWCDGFAGPAEPEVKLDHGTQERVWFHMGDFEKNFLRALDLEELDDLLDAALFLNIKSLLLLAGQMMASCIKDATPEQIRDWFGMPDGLAPERVEEIRHSDPWNPLVNVDDKPEAEEQPEVNEQPQEEVEPEPEIDEQPEEEEPPEGDD